MVSFIRKNEMTMKRQYNGLDLLKFVMALMVVMIHVKPNTHSEFLMNVFRPLLSIAVPIFFVVSSVLLFSKLNRGGTWKYLNMLRESVYFICVGW